MLYYVFCNTQKIKNRIYDLIIHYQREIKCEFSENDHKGKWDLRIY